MSSSGNNSTSAELRFRQAFIRLKDGNPEIMRPGASVSQNNVAREAGCDPSALKKSRFPSLIREIQAYVEIHEKNESSHRQSRIARRRATRSDEELKADLMRQRDAAQSLIASANRRIVELTEQMQLLQQRLDEVLPPPTPLRQR